MSLDAQYNWQSMRRRPLPRASRRHWQKGLVVVAMVLAVGVYLLLAILLARAGIFDQPANRVTQAVRLTISEQQRPTLPDAPPETPSSPDTPAEEIQVLEELEDLAEEQFDFAEPDPSTLFSQRDVELTPAVDAAENFLAIQSETFAPPETAAQDDAVTERLARQAAEVLNTTVGDDLQLRVNPGLDEDSTDYLKELTDGSGEGRQNRAALANFNTLGDMLGDGGGGGIDPNKPILMPTDLLFDFGSAELREGARAGLLMLGYIIDRSPEATFVIEGHTDSIGEPGANRELSRARAQAVADWLASRLLIDPSRFQVQGKGEEEPIVPANGDQQAEALNRRVEIVVKGKLGDLGPAAATEDSAAAGDSAAASPESRRRPERPTRSRRGRNSSADTASTLPTAPPPPAPRDPESLPPLRPEPAATAAESNPEAEFAADLEDLAAPSLPPSRPAAQPAPAPPPLEAVEAIEAVEAVEAEEALDAVEAEDAADALEAVEPLPVEPEPVR